MEQTEERLEGRKPYLKELVFLFLLFPFFFWKMCPLI